MYAYICTTDHLYNAIVVNMLQDRKLHTGTCGKKCHTSHKCEQKYIIKYTHSLALTIIYMLTYTHSHTLTHTHTEKDLIDSKRHHQRLRLLRQFLPEPSTQHLYNRKTYCPWNTSMYLLKAFLQYSSLSVSLSLCLLIFTSLSFLP